LDSLKLPSRDSAIYLGQICQRVGFVVRRLIKVIYVYERGDSQPPLDHRRHSIVMAGFSTTADSRIDVYLLFTRDSCAAG
jgi:hypothetical protein